MLDILLSYNCVLGNQYTLIILLVKGFVIAFKRFILVFFPSVVSGRSLVRNAVK